MPISSGDIIRTALQWFVDGANEQVNVHHFEVDDVGSTTGDLDFMETFAAMMLSELYSEVISQIADNVIGSVITGWNVTDGVALPPVDNPVNGIATGVDGYARQVTALVYLNTGVPRRQGRSYLPSFTEAAVEDVGSWSAGALVNVAQYAARLLDIITDGDISVHRVVTHPDGSSPLEPTFSGFAAYPRTQRRRTPGFGS